MKDKRIIQIEIVILIEIKQDQDQSNDYRDKSTLFHLLPQSRVNKIISNNNEIVSYQIEIDIIKTNYRQMLCCLINRKHDRIQTGSFSNRHNCIVIKNDPCHEHVKLKLARKWNHNRIKINQMTTEIRVLCFFCYQKVGLTES